MKKVIAYSNHTDVLSISIGGSFTKLMIAGTSKGEIIAKYVKIMSNPSEIISFYDYLDNLMVNDKVVYNYLKEEVQNLQ